MTEKQLEKLAEDIANRVMEKFTEISIFSLPEEDQEELLLGELASAMTKLDFELKRENYEACKVLKEKITNIENKLKKFK
jgi:CO dehydrogenase nickel-insertion accessory protein CooC1